MIGKPVAAYRCDFQYYTGGSDHYILNDKSVGIPSTCINTYPDRFYHTQEDTIDKHDIPEFRAGDNITVNYKIFEGEKVRTQAFKGDVIQRKGTGMTQTFTVKKVSSSIGVERVFPLYSPSIESIVINKQGKVRRAKLFYLRARKGKSARIKESR